MKYRVSFYNCSFFLPLTHWVNSDPTSEIHNFTCCTGSCLFVFRVGKSCSKPKNSGPRSRLRSSLRVGLIFDRSKSKIKVYVCGSIFTFGCITSSSASTF